MKMFVFSSSQLSESPEVFHLLYLHKKCQQIERCQQIEWQHLERGTVYYMKILLSSSFRNNQQSKNIKK